MRKRRLFPKRKVLTGDDKALIFKCLGECGMRFGIPHDVMRDRADRLISGFACPKCKSLYVKWENYKLFKIDER